jgi:GNAT superfamily N-acetyltransferase
MNPVIRKAKSEDIPTIIELTKEIAEFEKSDFNPEGKAEKLNEFLFGNSPRLFCLLVENENKVFGFATYSVEFSLFEADNYLRINSFYIRPNSRQKGIGKLLIEEVKKESRRLNCKIIQFFTPDFNSDAIQFYNRIGAKYKPSVRFYLDAGE